MQKNFHYTEEGRKARIEAHKLGLDKWYDPQAGILLINKKDVSLLMCSNIRKFAEICGMGIGSTNWIEDGEETDEPAIIVADTDWFNDSETPFSIPKAQFIKDYLEPMLRAANCDVERLQWCEESEIIIIHFVGGGTRSVNVFADSNIAMVSDVLRQGHLM